MLASSLLLVVAAGPSVRAEAHPLGGPAVAWPVTPHTVGNVVDEGYRFSWTDTNYLTPTATITIDWFYTRVMPPTFQLGASPPDLEGTPIVLGIDEADRTDAFTWDTSTVAAGSYWIWSRMNDLPGETSLRINAFSRGVITVAHPGDVVHPAIAMVTPRSPFEVSEQRTYDVVYEAFDPDGTGVVTLEAMRTRTATDTVLIARDLPAARSATVSWAVADLAEGDWILRAHLRDGRGLEATAYARFVLTIEHLIYPDAGPADVDVGPTVSVDGGLLPDIGSYDGGTREPPPGEGCSCAASRGDRQTTGEAALWSAGVFLGLGLLRRTRQRPATRSTSRT